MPSSKVELVENNQVGILSLSLDRLEEYGYEKGDTEGLVNTILGLKGVKMAIFLKESEEGIKMSFRSKHNVKVNGFAGDHLKSGGHMYAASEYLLKTWM